MQARSLRAEPLTLRRRRAVRERAGALLPGGGVAGEVFGTSIISFLNIYNTLLGLSLDRA